VPGLQVGQQYLFYIEGPGSSGSKRDPHARELTYDPAFPNCNCVLRDPNSFPWHNTGYRPPAFNDLIIYQLHVGTFLISPGNANGNFLDVIDRLPYLKNLGVNAIEPLPVVEFPTRFSMGYNGTDYFSPETDYGEFDEGRLRTYFDEVNSLLRGMGEAEYPSIDVLRGSDNQLRAMVDLCHLHGIAVLFDVVYNHAGGGFDDNSIWFFDRLPKGNNNDSLYFTDQGWAGGLVFAYWNNDVKQFLIDNTKFLYQEYRIDGLRFDEVSVMDRFGGWQTCHYITDTCHFLRPQAILIAEYWPVNAWVTKPTSEGGAGFDATWNDGLRDAIRGAIGQSAGGASASVDMDRIAATMSSPGLPNHWRAVQCIENHDLVDVNRGPRVPRLADASNPRSWYARSRSRVATGLLLTAPGIPMLFMGQEFLEDKQWSDDPNSGTLIYWGGLEGGDKIMVDHLRFTSELIAVRRRQPALRGEQVRVSHVHNGNRVIAFHRWLEGTGGDVVVVASLKEQTQYGYQIGFPGPGRWLEIFNSDVYDNWVNPMVAGNGGSVEANGSAMHGMPVSASITIPANSMVIFARDRGD
jgi:1,4-alpha-glucan branching enzyme